MSILITNAKIYQEGKLLEKNIYIENSSIKKISSQKITADKIINAKNKIIIPGLIDCHVHFREPGLTHKEDFLSGSMAAAVGGITTFLDMPNTIPPMTTLQRLEDKRKLAKKSIVNYGFHFGSTSDNIEEIKKARNVAAVKIYMDHTTGDLKIDNDDALQKIFSANKTVAVHAESSNILKAKKMIQKSGNRLYICHCSSKEELFNAKKDKIKNEVFVEVCPHHLFMDETATKELNNFALMKPTLKTKNDQKALWEGIHNGMVDTIATDHAPHTKKEKKDGCPYGVPGVETMLPLLLNQANASNNRLPLQKIVQLCSENPASIFRIKNKGKIKEGFDADLTLIDLSLKKEVENKKLLTKCKWSPYEGWKLQGWPTMTIANGAIVFDDGKINKIAAKEVIFDVSKTAG